MCIPDFARCTSRASYICTRPLAIRWTEYDTRSATSSIGFGFSARLAGLLFTTPGDDADERVIDPGVELLSNVDLQVLECSERRQRVPVCALRGESVKCIGDAKYPAPEQDGLSGNSMGISGAVPVLVVVRDVGER